MKKLILLLAILFVSVSFQSDDVIKHCPLTGNAKSKRIQQLNVLKNRTPTPEVSDPSITLEKILAPGNDTGRFKNTQYATITGFLYKYKWGGSESCNCGSTNKSDEDLHLEIAESLIGFIDGKDIMVCEITWRSRFHDSTLTESYIRTLVGKKVTLSGYMFFDAEHFQNATNTNPTGTDIWRNSCWELHPTVSIKQSL